MSTKVKTSQRPQVFGYSHYQTYLTDLVAFIRRHQPKFSFRQFCQRSGFSSPSTLKLILDGKRGLSLQSAKKVAKGLELSAQEIPYFLDLVMFNQAKTPDQKRMYAQRLLEHQRHGKLKTLEQAQLSYLSQWYIPAIRELVGFKDFLEDPLWISQQLLPRITPVQARHALDTLLTLGLVTRNCNNRLILQDRALTTGDEIRNIGIKHFHREMSMRAIDAIDTVPSELRDITGMTIGLPRREVPQLKKMLARFRSELQKKLGSLEEPSEEIYHLNLQLFPLTQRSVS